MSPLVVRSALDSDLRALAALLDAYMRETFSQPWHGDEKRLRESALGRDCRLLVADEGGALVGFAAWHPTFDLHHCMRGGALIDLYVTRARRGRAFAAHLLTAVCAEIRDAGGRFIMGQSVADPSVRSLYERLAHSFPGESCYVSGRAFRALADLRGADTRALARAQIPREWNYES